MLRVWTLCLALSTLVVSSIPTMAEPNPSEPRVRAQLSDLNVITSSGTGLAARETDGPDTFVLYGGPDHPTEGKFQLANGVTPDWGGGNGLPGGYGGGPDAWTPVDLTDDGGSYWHVDTFNAANLNSNGAGNRAMWCGVGPGDPRAAGFATLPGYGHSWNTWLEYTSAPVADHTVGQTVGLEFYFNFDHEPGYGDKFLVEYDSAGSWVEVLDTNNFGSNKTEEGEFLEPGELFSAFSTRTIQYDGWDYGGEDGDQILIRLRFTSDGGWDPQDGLWPTDAGAAQVDDITLSHLDGGGFEDFEGPGPYLFEPEKRPKAGDFADVYPRLTDLDPCVENSTPLVGFVDYGQVVRNGPGHTGMVTGGGSTSPGIEYGIPGNWVVNYRGGISEGLKSINNEIWSPEIQWDLPGPDDDAQEVVGAKIRWTTWTHLPLINGIFFVWGVRSASAGQEFGPWYDRNFVYYSGGQALWLNTQEDVTDLLYSNPERVQMSLGVLDYASVFGFPGTASTPAPCFDNAAFYKYRVGGPAIATRTIDLAQDGFPVSGGIDVSTQAGRDALDIPFSMARDVNTGDSFNTPGDSVIVDVISNVGDHHVADLRMVWALQTNPLFEDAIRSAPARPVDESVVAGASGTVWTGEVIADTSRTSSGATIRNRFFVDLPDVDFMYPGDVLHYYVRAEDSYGNVSTLPADISGFADFTGSSAFDRVFRVRGLPSLRDAAGSQPEILVVNDFGLSTGTDAYHYNLMAHDLQSLGYAEGVEFDSYTVLGASSAVSNGIGSAYAHGATPVQVGGYSHILYRSGTVASALLCDGSNSGNNDKGNDVGLMEAWHALSGTRNVAYFGDNVAACLSSNSPASLGYLTDTMAVEQLSACGGYYGSCGGVRDVIGGQTAPIVTPAPAYAGNFSTDFVAFGGCPSLNAFDHIQPLGSAQAGHYFTDVSGNPITDPTSGVASVINDTGNGLVVTVPIATFFIQDVVSRGTGLSARARLVSEILGLFGAGAGGSPVVGAPSWRGVQLSASPNPFNPSTMVSFTAEPGARGFVKVFNLRGELVRVLHSGEFVAQEFRWDGTDTRGAPVGSGVYLIRATDGATTQTQKVALVK